MEDTGILDFRPKETAEATERMMGFGMGRK